ncbi:cytochrome P450 3A19-like [Limulus polyphemus]|uniref:Cytochrome P450 3A19-like n=1 Tax=Limulus polyphemus TaxID=6850 RepID=A0ABM1T863_LIMPO|nr:cytochrome P450 3A19-like [Limulus polyphemus]
MVQSRVKYGNVTIPEGIQIQVPVYHLHHSSEYWDNPEKFDPTRFSPENRSSINPMVYQAFGQGPRNCIGIRFAQMEAKLALAKLLYWFELTLDESPEEKLSVQINQHTLTPEKGVFVKAIPRR